MRSTVALAGLAAGVALLAGPVAPASAYCEHDPTGGTSRSGECRNSCVETGNRYEAAREKLGLSALPSYWTLFACPMS